MRILVTIAVGIALFWVSCGGEGTEVANSNSTETQTTTANNTASNTPAPKEIKGTPITIRGNVTGMGDGQKVFFDKKTIDATEVIASVPVSAGGDFLIHTGINEPGIYRLRLGASPVYLILEGNEEVAFSATLEERKVKEYTLAGSPILEEMAKWPNRPDPKAIVSYIETAEADKAWLSCLLVTKLDVGAHINLYKKVKEQLAEVAPNVAYSKNFQTKVAQTEAQLSAQPVRVGTEAPEISLPNPDGKDMALSDLKGKVVLIDFWASWCRPCRHENPNVVRIYKKYKKQGFTVYSVSLDGIDDRRLASIQGKPEQVKQAMEAQRTKWRNAIKEDKLEWKSHVSELRGWSTQSAIQYGVNSIPRTFLLDRDGKIRFMNLRGAQLEAKVKELL
ncbi:MAG: AhpC/TSA family protein [Aureispira sp.]|nr:AhpC/TSA family protein [Aureispira sp.]